MTTAPTDPAYHVVTVPACECCGWEDDLRAVTITPMSPYPRLRLRALDGRKAIAWLCGFCADDV